MPDAAQLGVRADAGMALEVRRVRVRGFRNLAMQEATLGEGVTLIWGPNGAGKTNLLEALCVGLTGRSCRTRNDRELCAFGETVARVEVEVCHERDAVEFAWSRSREGERRHTANAVAVTDQATATRPPLSIFLPDRLALIKGPPGERRSHFDRLAAALWPARVEVRRRYGSALAQRNALLGRIRGGLARADALEAWDAELAAAGMDLMELRRRSVEALAPEFTAAAGELGLEGEATLRYAPRSRADDATALLADLRERRETDIARGFTTSGPHLDEIAISAESRLLRRYGSQGEQRTALLALLFAERRAVLEARRTPPLMLLDDVMSELDPARRARLARRLAEAGGQALITATEANHLPSGCERLEIPLRQGECLAASESGGPAREPASFPAA